MGKEEKALDWIISILNKLDVPYQISGGLAARVYGSKRPLADIDIDIPESFIPDIFSEVKSYVIFGPERYRDDEFDIDLMTLDYNGQEIDLAGFGSGRIFDKRTGVWVDDVVDLSKSEIHEVLGSSVPVINRDDLVNYKSRIRRDVDLEDIEQIQGG